VTPLLEIYSEHGNAESDEGPFDYIRHSMGGRWTPNTYQAVLDAGYRVGALASSDDHLGYPGAYGEGLAAIQAKELTREALFDALRNRRTYGVTGDRIRLDFRLNGKPMGSEIPYTRNRRIEVSAVGWDAIKAVEVIKNGRVVHRDFPIDRKVSSDLRRARFLVKLEFGWGPWADLAMPRVCDWDFEVDIDGGRIVEVQPCFQCGPLDEERRNRIFNRSDDGLTVQSYTSRLQAFAERPTNAVVLRIDGALNSSVNVILNKPSDKALRKNIGELYESNEVLFTGPFPDESMLIHRPVPEAAAKTSFDITDDSPGDRADWYYIRVEQQNGHLAWSSPVWVEKRI
jgi:hypothetical protein